MALKDKAQKFWRGVQRRAAGPSNQMTSKTEPTVTLDGQWVPSVVVRHDKFENPTQLEFETSRPVLAGDARAVHDVRCLDSMIGQLTAPFNRSAAPVPDAVVEKILSHGRDLAPAFRRISAHPAGQPGMRVPELSYTALRSVNGETVPQVIATFKLGQGKLG